jgi:di/tricarboxylate transporter
MKEKRSESDARVRKLLHDWKVTIPLPPRFSEGVWQRIERAEAEVKASPLDVLRGWFADVMPRPAVAFSYITILLIIGMATGQWQARMKSNQLHTELSRRYVQTVDPYQKAHSP